MMSTSQSPVPSKENELSKAMYNPLEKVTKKADLKKTFSSEQVWSSKKNAPNQISIPLDKFENRLIKKRRFHE